jgi:hypothetical protein
VYVFEQLDEAMGWVRCVGVQLVPGSVAATVMPDLEASMRAELPDGDLVRLLALSRRMLATVRRHAGPLWEVGQRPRGGRH